MTSPYSAPGSDAKSDCGVCGANLYFDEDAQDCIHCKFPRALNSEALWDTTITDTGVYTCELCPSYAIPQFLPEQSPQNVDICDTVLALEEDGTFVQQDTYISLVDTSKYICNTGHCQAVPGRILSRLVFDDTFLENNRILMGTGLQQRAIRAKTQLFMNGDSQNKYVFNIALAVCKAPHFCDPHAAFDIHSTSVTDGLTDGNLIGLPVFADKTDFEGNAFGTCAEGHVILQHAASVSTACIAIPSNMVITEGINGNIGEYMESSNLHKNWYYNFARQTLIWTPYVPGDSLFVQYRDARAVPIAALPQESAQVACNAGYELSIAYAGTTPGVSTQQIGVDPGLTCVSCADGHYSFGGATEAPTTNPNAVAGYCKRCEQDCHTSTLGWSMLLASYDSTQAAYNLCPGEYQRCSTSNGQTSCSAAGSGQNLKSYDFLSYECGWREQIDAQVQKYGCGADSAGYCGCPVGHFMQIIHSAGQQCTNARGVYNSANSDCSIQCSPCAAGSVGTALGFDETCTRCPAGQQPSDDQSVCEACPPGSYSESGSVCSVCEFGPTDVIRQSNTDPDLWDYSATGGTACERCNSGYYFDQTLNPRSCVACAPGTWKTYNALETNATCAECTGCAAGEYVESCDATDGSAVTCVTCDCATGTYCVWNDAHELTCQACDDCPPGTERQECGQFDTGACTACPTGKFKNSHGTSECSDCVPCAAMTRRTIECEGSNPGTCESCPDGLYSLVETEGCQQCQDCERGTFDPCCAWGNGVHNDWYCGVDGTNSHVGCDACGSPAPSTCQECPANHYKTESSDNYCDACAEAMAYGRHPACADLHKLEGCGGGSVGTCTQCETLQYFDACTNTCIDLQADHKRVNVTCTNLLETVGTMPVQCPCWLEDNTENPAFATQVAVSCGQYAVQRDANQDDSAAGICHCIDGYEPFIPEDDAAASQCVGDECCKQCGYHSYSANSQPCQLCSNVSPNAGHIQYAQINPESCVCKPGFGFDQQASDESSAKICNPCLHGEFKNWFGDDACALCEAGKYSNNHTINCHPDSRREGTGREFLVCRYEGAYCETCPANTYCTGEGNAAATACPPNTESPAGSTSVEACQCVYPYVLKDDLALERQCVHREDLCEENQYQTDATATCADFCEDATKRDSGDDDCAAHPLDLRYALSLSHPSLGIDSTADAATAEAASLAAWRLEMLAVVERMHNPNQGVGYGGRSHLHVMPYPVTTIDGQESYNFAIVFDRELYYGLCGIADVATLTGDYTATQQTAQQIFVDILQLPFHSLDEVYVRLAKASNNHKLYENLKDEGRTKLYSHKLCTTYHQPDNCITPQDVCTEQNLDCADKTVGYAQYAYAIVPMHPDNTDLDNYVTQWTQANMHCCANNASDDYACNADIPDDLQQHYLDEGRALFFIDQVSGTANLWIGGQGIDGFIRASNRYVMRNHGIQLYYNGPYPISIEKVMKNGIFTGTAPIQTLPWHRQPALFGHRWLPPEGIDIKWPFQIHQIPIINARFSDIENDNMFGTFQHSACTDQETFEWGAVLGECADAANIDREPLHACVCSIKKCTNSNYDVFLPNPYHYLDSAWPYFMTPLVDTSDEREHMKSQHAPNFEQIGDLVQIHGYVLEVKNTMCEQEVIHERIYVPLGNSELLDRVAETSEQCADIKFGAPFLPSTTHSFSDIGGIDAKSIYYARIATVGKSVQVRIRTWTSYGFSKPSAWHVLRDDQRSCSPCPPHSTNSDRAATDVTACQCNAGYTHILAPEYACVECASGKYKPTSGTTDCVECNPGDNTYWASNSPRISSEACVLTDPLLATRQLEPGFMHGTATVDPLVVCLNYAAAHREALLSPGRLIENQCVAIDVCSGSSVRLDPVTGTYSTPLPLATDVWHHRSSAALLLSHEAQETSRAQQTTPSTFTVTGSQESPEKILLMDTTFVLTVGQQVVVNWAATAADNHPFGLSTTHDTYTAVPDNIATQIADDANTLTTITLHSTDTQLFYMCRNGHGFSGVAVQMFAAPTVYSSHHNHYHVEYARIPAGVVLETAPPDLDLYRRTQAWQPITSLARRVIGTCNFTDLTTCTQNVEHNDPLPVGELGTTQMLRFSLREGYVCAADGIAPGTRLQHTGEEQRVPAQVVSCPQGEQDNGVYSAGCVVTCNDGFEKDENDQCVSICSVLDYPFSAKCDGTDRASGECGSNTHKRYQCQRCWPRARSILLQFDTADPFNCQYEECAPGFISSADNTCIPCPVHTRQELNACTDCLVEEELHQPLQGQAQCAACLFHQWDNTSHTYNCAPGQHVLTTLQAITAYTAQHASQIALPFSEEGQENAHHTDLMRTWCAQGYACLPCVPGTAAQTGGMQACESCAQGLYQNNYGSTACVHCSPGDEEFIVSQTTLQQGSTSHEDCVCSDGHGVPPA